MRKVVDVTRNDDSIVPMDALYLQSYFAPVADRGSGTGPAREVRRPYQHPSAHFF